jgi:hypothetical protein
MGLFLVFLYFIYQKKQFSVWQQKTYNAPFRNMDHNEERGGPKDGQIIGIFYVCFGETPTT